MRFLQNPSSSLFSFSPLPWCWESAVFDWWVFSNQLLVLLIRIWLVFSDVMSLLVTITPIGLKFRLVTKDGGIVILNLNGLDSRGGHDWWIYSDGLRKFYNYCPLGILTLAYATSRNEWKLLIFVVTSIDANWGTPVLNYWPEFQILY